MSEAARAAAEEAGEGGDDDAEEEEKVEVDDFDDEAETAEEATMSLLLSFPEAAARVVVFFVVFLRALYFARDLEDITDVGGGERGLRKTPAAAAVVSLAAIDAPSELIVIVVNDVVADRRGDLLAEGAPRRCCVVAQLRGAWNDVDCMECARDRGDSSANQ